MTVKELIEALRQFPDNMICLSVGYDECGYDPVRPPKRIKVVLMQTRGAHVGHYDDCYDEEHDDCVEAVYIR